MDKDYRIWIYELVNKHRAVQCELEHNALGLMRGVLVIHQDGYLSFLNNQQGYGKVDDIMGFDYSYGISEDFIDYTYSGNIVSVKLLIYDSDI